MNAIPLTCLSWLFNHGEKMNSVLQGGDFVRVRSRRWLVDDEPADRRQGDTAPGS
jgi:hypothetical protein